MLPKMLPSLPDQVVDEKKQHQVDPKPVQKMPIDPE
jgi:hypothetical protein